MVSRYNSEVDPTANNCHSISLRLVGWNKRVLELGAASGHMTRALAAQNCRVTAIEYEAESAMDIKGVAEAVIVGDLNDPQTLAGVTGPFDVVLAGDVLEHLLDPQSVLVTVANLLAPNGRVVVSLPNVAHVDLRLSLLAGNFDYRPWGLLDRTHIRFFTHKTLKELVRGAGLTVFEMHRVRIPAFATELAVDRASVSSTVLNEILADPEAETYQFVFAAVRTDDAGHLAQLAERYEALQVEHDNLLVAHQVVQARHRELRRKFVALESQLQKATARRDALRRELRRLKQSRTFRYSAPARALVRRARAARKSLGG